MPLIVLLVASFCAPTCSFVSFDPFVSFASGSFVSFDSFVSFPSQKKPTVHVYVFASSVPGAPKEEDAAREEAVNDLRDQLRRKAGLELVDGRTEADVLVEVLGREERNVMEGGFGGAAVTKMGETIIRVHLTSGDEEADLKGIGQGTWGRAAKDAAERIVKWIARLESKKGAAEYAEYAEAAEYAEHADYVEYVVNVQHVHSAYSAYSAAYKRGSDRPPSTLTIDPVA